MKVPVEVVESGYMTKLYIRTYAFNNCKITYDFETYKAFESAENNNKPIFRVETQQIVQQPYDINFIDCMSKQELIEIDCIPLPKFGLVVEISDQALSDSSDDIEQAIYEQLTSDLDVDFAYEY
jgi:hypothetical protein